MSSFTLRLDEKLALALRRMAAADERTMAAELRHLIREQAVVRGFWGPRRPQPVTKPSRAHGGVTAD